MNYLPLAITTAVQAHGNTKDRGGNFYILHPLRLMLKCTDITEQIVAVLHDVIEDTHITLSYIKNLGFSDEVITALNWLSKTSLESYEHYIQDISKNTLATKIKLLDLYDNIDITRLHTITDNDLKRVKKYHAAIQVLEGTKNVI